MSFFSLFIGVSGSLILLSDRPAISGRRSTLNHSRGSNFTTHVGEQRILKCSLQHSNLVGVQLVITNLAYSLRQLVGYESCQSPGPLLLYEDDILNVVPPVHQKSENT